MIYMQLPSWANDTQYGRSSVNMPEGTECTAASGGRRMGAG